jgi:hypothetical protein
LHDSISYDFVMSEPRVISVSEIMKRLNAGRQRVRKPGDERQVLAAGTQMEA